MLGGGRGRIKLAQNSSLVLPRAITQGKDAQGEVTVELQHRGRHVRGRGVSTDVIEASAKAYLAAINRIRSLETRANGNGGQRPDQP